MLLTSCDRLFYPNCQGAWGSALINRHPVNLHRRPSITMIEMKPQQHPFWHDLTGRGLRVRHYNHN